MLPGPHHMRNTQGRAGSTNCKSLLDTLGAQTVIYRHRLNPQPGGQAQMQKGGGIPTARKRHSDRLARRQAVADQTDQPILFYWHAKPCIATVACVAAMLPG